MSESFFKALTLPEQVVKRNMDTMSKYVFSNTANQWGEGFLKKLEEVGQECEGTTEAASSSLNYDPHSKLDVVIVSRENVKKMGDFIQAIESKSLQTNTVFLTSLKDAKLPALKHSKLLVFTPKPTDITECMKSIGKIVEYFAERTPGSVISRGTVPNCIVYTIIESSAMVYWRCGCRIWCLAIDTNLSQFEEHRHRSWHKGTGFYLQQCLQDLS